MAGASVSTDGAFSASFYWTSILAVLVLAGLAIWIAHLAYEARRAREQAAARPAPAGPDPVVELARVNARIRETLVESRSTLEATRETLRRGIRG